MPGGSKGGGGGTIDGIPTVGSGGSNGGAGFDWQKNLPLLIAGLQGVGGALNAKAGAPSLMSIPPPANQYPAFNQQYLGSIAGVSGPSFSALGKFAQNGMPTNFMDSFNALKEASQRGIAEGRANLMEKYGARGTRFGTTMGNAAVDYEAQTQKDFAGILAEFARQSQEGAANRQLNAATFGAGLGAEPALSTYPTSVLTGGGQSPLGQGLTAAGGGILNYLLLQQLMTNRKT